jgi:IS4 transposase
LLFRKLKSRYALTRFETEKAAIVCIQILLALLTLVVIRAILWVLCDHAEEQGNEYGSPTERWAATFRSAVPLILLEIAAPPGIRH